MNKVKIIDLKLHVLNHQIEDVDGMRCGRVDDLQLNLMVGKKIEVTHLLVGPGVWTNHFPETLKLFVQDFLGKEIIRIKIKEIAQIGTSIKLKAKAINTGENLGHEKLVKENIDYFKDTLFQLLRYKFKAKDGTYLGKIKKITAEFNSQGLFIKELKLKEKNIIWERDVIRKFKDQIFCN
jgi:sporulation protein YlmC with PRC-barrel domain